MASLKLALKIDAENPVIGDIYLHNGTVQLTQTLAEEVAQEIFVCLRFFKGEWFLDEDQGFPWFQTVLGHKLPLNIVSGLIRQMILDRPGVASVETLKLERLPERALGVTFVVKCIDGATLNSSDFGEFIVGAVT